MGTQLNSDPWDTRFLDGKREKKLFSSSEKATEKGIRPSSGKYSVGAKTGSASAISAPRRAPREARVHAKRGRSWEDPTESRGRQEGGASTARSGRLIPSLLGSASQLILGSAEASFGESGYNSKSFHCTDCMHKDWEILGFAFHAFLEFSYFLQYTCYFIIGKNNKYYFK